MPVRRASRKTISGNDAPEFTLIPHFAEHRKPAVLGQGPHRRPESRGADGVHNHIGPLICGEGHHHLPELQTGLRAGRFDHVVGTVVVEHAGLAGRRGYRNRASAQGCRELYGVNAQAAPRADDDRCFAFGLPESACKSLQRHAGRAGQQRGVR